MADVFGPFPALRRTAEQVFTAEDLSRKLASRKPLTEPEQRHPVSSGDVIRVGRRRWFRIVARRSAP